MVDETRPRVPAVPAGELEVAGDAAVIVREPGPVTAPPLVKGGDVSDRDHDGRPPIRAREPEPRRLAFGAVHGPLDLTAERADLAEVEADGVTVGYVVERTFDRGEQVDARESVVLDDEVVCSGRIVRSEGPNAGVVAVLLLVPHDRHRTVQACEEIGHHVGPVWVGHDRRGQGHRASHRSIVDPM